MSYRPHFFLTSQSSVLALSVLTHGIWVETICAPSTDHHNRRKDTLARDGLRARRAITRQNGDVRKQNLQLDCMQTPAM